MDGLSIITGIFGMVFLLLYLAFNLNDKENKIVTIIKVFLIMFGLFIMSYIPATMISLDRDCGILSNGTYLCYMSNGTQVSTYGVSTTQVGSGLSTVYITFLYFASAFVIVLTLVILGKWVIDWWKGRKLV